MTELQELTYDKDFDQLQVELMFQVDKMGEAIGGTICSEIVSKLEQIINSMPHNELKDLYLDYFNKYLSIHNWSLDHGFCDFVGELILNRGRKIERGELN